MRLSCALAVVLCLLSLPPVARAQGPALVGIGDSIGQGVQSGDASTSTQPWSFVNIIAWRAGAAFPLPLIRTGPFATVGSMSGRSRVDPTVRAYNLAVSGADVHSLLYDAATAVTTAQIDSETELVLFPRVGSQMDIVEQLRPRYVVCWIGANDALDAALDFSRLDASQLTPVADFTADFTQIVQRIQATGARGVFGTIPDVTSIGYLLNRQDLVRMLGSDYGLPAGNLTTLSAVAMVRLGLLNSSAFTDPDYSLDPAEQQTISNHIALLNTVIRTTVAAHGMALAETHGFFESLSQVTVTLWGAPLTTQFLGGWFSLDGVHPSNIGQTFAAMLFIDAMNRHYGAGIPQLDANMLFAVTATDPFVDRDRDGRVQGRRGAGLLETMLALLGYSGDTAEGALSPTAPSGVTPLVRAADEPVDGLPTARAGDPAAASALDAYRTATGRDLRKMSPQDRIDAMRELFEGRARRRR